MKQGAIILCGGQSKRMGADKASLPFGPEYMLQRVVRIVAESVALENVAVVASPGQDLPELPEQVIVTRDRHPNRGPMEGLASGLAALPRDVEAAYLTGCDTPLLVSAWIEELFRLLENDEIVVPLDGEHYHPLSAVYCCHLLPEIEAALSAGRMALHKFIAQRKTKEVPVDQLRNVDPDLHSLKISQHSW